MLRTPIMANTIGQDPRHQHIRVRTLHLLVHCHSRQSHLDLLRLLTTASHTTTLLHHGRIHSHRIIHPLRIHRKAHLNPNTRIRMAVHHPTKAATSLPQGHFKHHLPLPPACPHTNHSRSTNTEANPFFLPTWHHPRHNNTRDHRPLYLLSAKLLHLHLCMPRRKRRVHNKHTRRHILTHPLCNTSNSSWKDHHKTAVQSVLQTHSLGPDDHTEATTLLAHSSEAIRVLANNGEEVDEKKKKKQEKKKGK